METIFVGGLEEAVEGLERERVVGLVASRHDGEQRQIMTILMNNQMIVTVSKEITVPVGIVAPLGGRRGVVPIMAAAVYSLRATRAGGFSPRGCSGPQDRAVTAKQKMV